MPATGRQCGVAAVTNDAISGRPQVPDGAGRGKEISRRRPIVDALIERGDFRYPALAIGMLEVHDGLERPVEVISDEGYLLV
jgi:hypothetical protein